MSEPSSAEPNVEGIGSSPATTLRGQVLRALGEILQTGLIALLLFLAVNMLTARIRVEGISMEPSLQDGQFVVVNRLAYRWQDPQRGDVVVFHFPLDPSRRFIKRIIGLPGEVISIRQGQVHINGAPLQEPYVSASAAYNGEWRLSPNEVFVLGDNRNNSSDSHRWGPLPEREIIGKAFLVYWPPETIGLIPHFEPALSAEK